MGGAVIGIDVAKAHLDVAVRETAGVVARSRSATTPDALAACVARVSAHAPALVV
jgi:hypothetical protein